MPRKRIEKVCEMIDHRRSSTYYSGFPITIDAILDLHAKGFKADDFIDLKTKVIYDEEQKGHIVGWKN